MNVVSITSAFSQSNGVFLLERLWQQGVPEKTREFPDKHPIFYTKSQNWGYHKVKFRMNARGKHS